MAENTGIETVHDVDLADDLAARPQRQRQDPANPLPTARRQLQHGSTPVPMLGWRALTNDTRA
jgi:hypothetical protein